MFNEDNWIPCEGLKKTHYFENHEGDSPAACGRAWLPMEIKEPRREPIRCSLCEYSANKKINKEQQDKQKKVKLFLLKWCKQIYLVSSKTRPQKVATGEHITFKFADDAQKMCLDGSRYKLDEGQCIMVGLTNRRAIL